MVLPPVGTFQLEVGGGGKGGRYAALQNLDLRLGFVDPPEVIEIGNQGTFRVRLATPGGRVPNAAFLDRHQVSVATAYQQRCPEALAERGARAAARPGQPVRIHAGPAPAPGDSASWPSWCRDRAGC